MLALKSGSFFRQFFTNTHSIQSVFVSRSCSNMSAPPLHDALKPLTWLVGKWTSNEGKGIYPTIDDFSYGEEIEFKHVGQPNLQFSASSWHAKTKKKLHIEFCFLTIKPDTSQVAFICAQNAGLAEVEEGQLEDNQLSLESHTVARLSFGKPPGVKKIKRQFKLLGNGDLEQVVDMETENTPMAEHLRIIYKKVD